MTLVASQGIKYTSEATGIMRQREASLEHILVMEVDFRPNAATVTATIIDNKGGLVESLPLGWTIRSALTTWPPSVVRNGLKRVAVAHRRRFGVVATPDTLTIRYPQDWTAHHMSGLRQATKEGGLDTSGVIVRLIPVRYELQPPSPFTAWN